MTNPESILFSDGIELQLYVTWKSLVNTETQTFGIKSFTCKEALLLRWLTLK